VDPAFGAPLRIGDKDMVCPAKDSVARNRFGFEVPPVDFVFASFSVRGACFPRKTTPRSLFLRSQAPSSDQRFEADLAIHHRTLFVASVCRSPCADAGRPGDLILSPIFSHPVRAAVYSRPRLAPSSSIGILAGSAAPPRVAPKRVSHGQQNAYRFVSPRRNQGGRPSR
jgi:hypothetical protein